VAGNPSILLLLILKQPTPTRPAAAALDPPARLDHRRSPQDCRGLVACYDVGERPTASPAENDGFASIMYHTE